MGEVGGSATESACVPLSVRVSDGWSCGARRALWSRGGMRRTGTGQASQGGVDVPDVLRCKVDAADDAGKVEEEVAEAPVLLVRAVLEAPVAHGLK